MNFGQLTNRTFFIKKFISIFLITFSAVFLISFSQLYSTRRAQLSINQDFIKQNKISIVIPFHIKQLNALIENIKKWDLYKPCTNNDDIKSFTNDDINLYFYVGYSSSDESLIDNLIKMKNDYKNSFNCFSRIEIVKYKYSSENQDKHVLGSRLMFEHMLLKNETLFEKLTYVFYMEPDCRSIKTNWLSCLLSHVLDENFWIKGSLFRGDDSLIAKNYLPYFFHLNGNAIYNIGDQKFRDFYFKKLRPYVVKKHGDSFNAYDTDFFEYLLDTDNYPTTKNIFHKFKMSSFIQNYWYTQYSLNQFDSDTCFVHGGKPLNY